MRWRFETSPRLSAMVRGIGGHLSVDSQPEDECLLSKSCSLPARETPPTKQDSGDVVVEDRHVLCRVGFG